MPDINNPPVLFLIFNRPDVTKIVFEAIRKAQPAKLYVAADGARPDKEGETEKCEAARAIIDSVDWDCEVKKLFREKNLGCKIAVSSAIDWFFQQEEEGIILEDDCLPDQSFFGYCAELLPHYRNHEQVMHIGGANFQDGIRRGAASYYFSRYNFIWGWATWRRAWKHYNVTMNDFPKFLEDHRIARIFQDKKMQTYWLKNMEIVYSGQRDTWDAQWSLAIWQQDGCCISPNINLVSNIGFGRDDATHTKMKFDKISNLRIGTIDKIMHPPAIELNPEADLYSYKIFNPNYFIKAKIIIRSYVNKFFHK